MPPSLWSNEWMRKNLILLIMLDNLVWRVLPTWSCRWWLWRRLACECDHNGKIIVCWGGSGHVDAGLGRGRRETTKMANEGFLLCLSYISQIFQHLACFLTVSFNFSSYILMSIMLSQVSSTFLIFSHITVVHFYAASSMFMFC